VPLIVEISVACVLSWRQAQLNIAMNNVGGCCTICRAPSGKFVTKILRKPKVKHHRSKPRVGANGGAEERAAIPSSHMAYGTEFNFKTILVDPPRAGCDDSTLPHLKRCVIAWSSLFATSRTCGNSVVCGKQPDCAWIESRVCWLKSVFLFFVLFCFVFLR
jgi:hypothetical protein